MVPSVWDELDIGRMLEKAKNSADENPIEYGDLTDRIKRTLYYDPLKKPDTDTLSFSATRSAVSRFRHVAPMPSGKLGHRYASRVARDACISPCALLLGLIYIERLKHKNSSYLENISSSDLFLVSMMVASKYLYDEGCEDEVFNDEWAVSGEITVARVNKLEREFLKAIDWQLYVNPQQFSSMLNLAESDVALSNGRKRGWLTYSDLRSLLGCQSIYKQLTQTAGVLSKVTCVCMILYSGVVCLAAVTSTALISFSTRPIQNRTPFGPHFYGNRAEVDNEENATMPDSTASLDSNEIICLIDNGFPGFPSEAGDVCFRNVDHKRFRPRQFATPDHIPPIGFNTAHLPPDNETLILDLKPPTAFIDSKQDQPSQPSSELQQRKSTTYSVLEAVLFMAHVPALCGFKDEIPDQCHKCGKPDVNTRTLMCHRCPTFQHIPALCGFKDEIPDQCHKCGKPDVNTRTLMCHRWDSFNSSIHFDPLHDLPTLPRRSQSFGPLTEKSLLGVFNPTVPPLLHPMPNLTHYNGFPMMVH